MPIPDHCPCEDGPSRCYIIGTKLMCEMEPDELERARQEEQEYLELLSGGGEE